MSAVRCRSSRRALTAAAGLALAISACTGQAEDGSENGADSEAGRRAAIEAAPHLVDAAGRLAVLGVDDEVFLIDPDGTDRRDLAPADPSIVERSPPTWSPSGSALAYTERSEADAIHLVVAGADGAIESRTEVPFMSGYVAWSAAEDRVAVMGNDDDGALRLSLVEPGGTARDLAEGVPLYLDWQPDGSAILVHVDDRLLLIGRDGQTEAIETDGEFRVPIHIGQGVLYGVDAGIGDVLVFNDGSGDRPRGLLRFAPPAAYVAAPDGERIAVLARGARESAAVVEFDDPLLSTLAPSRLEIMDVPEGRLTTVVEGPAIAWFWSPDGRLLLFSESVVEGRETLVRWSTYQLDGDSGTEPGSGSGSVGRIEAYTPFRPSGEYARGYLAFFDQMARSSTFWSPDSDAFVYAGGLPPPNTAEIALTTRSASEEGATEENPGDENSTGDDPTDRDGPISGIWVQRLGDFDPVRVTDGQVAVWSPN